MMRARRERIAVIFHRLGPYHLARLAATAHGSDVLSIEESAETSEYAWEVVGGRRSVAGLERVTLLGRGERPARPAQEMARRLEALLDRVRPAVVVIPGWSDPAALAALRWGLRNGVPSVVMSESTAFDEPRRAWKEWIKSRVVRRCAAGLVGGKPHAAYLADLGVPRDRIFPGYDAVDNTHFAHGADAARDDAAARDRLGLPTRYFLASSRFLPQKNLPGLLDAFAAYHRAAGPGAWKLVVLGDGPLRGELNARIAALDMEDHVSLPGFKQYDALPAYYGLAGAFVHASTREPWGLVVNEAMAAGLPVLVSDRCGCAQDLIASGQNGWTFPPDDPVALASLLARVAGGGSATLASMGEASRQRIENWSPAVFAANLAHAVQTAREHPPRALGMLDRLLVAFLLRRAEDATRRLLPSTSEGATRAVIPSLP